jgi:hypothetical protein
MDFNNCYREIRASPDMPYLGEDDYIGIIYMEWHNQSSNVKVSIKG